MMQDQRLQWVDMAKGIGIVLVVYGHVQQGLSLSGMTVPGYFYYAEKIIYSFHMHLFFFLSGYFVEKSLVKGSSVFFLKNISKILLYPYFLWSLLHGLIQISLSPYTNEKLHFADLLLIAYKPIAHFWFLQALFLANIVYAVLRKRFALTHIFIVAMSMYAIRFFVDLGPANNLSRLFVFFVAGSLFAEYIQKSSVKVTLWNAVVAIGIFALFHACFYYFGFSDQPIVKFIAACVGIICIVSVSLYIQDKNIFNILQSIGFVAMPIYLAHTMGAAGARIILGKIIHIHNVSAHLILGSIAGLLFPIILYILMKKLGFPYLFTLNKRSALAKALVND